MSRPRISSIYHMANADAPQGSEAKRRNTKAMRELWQRMGVAVIDPNDINNDLDRQHLKNMAEKLYGKRKGGK